MALAKSLVFVALAIAAFVVLGEIGRARWEQLDRIQGVSHDHGVNGN